MSWKPSNKRLYGYQHRKRREQLLPYAYGKLCPMCNEVMHRNQGLDLDHSLPIARGGAVGDRIVHRECNRRAGQELGRETQRLNKAKPSRPW